MVLLEAGRLHLFDQGLVGRVVLELVGERVGLVGGLGLLLASLCVGSRFLLELTLVGLGFLALLLLLLLPVVGKRMVDEPVEEALAIVEVALAGSEREVDVVLLEAGRLHLFDQGLVRGIVLELILLLLVVVVAVLGRGALELLEPGSGGLGLLARFLLGLGLVELAELVGTELIIRECVKLGA